MFLTLGEAAKQSGLAKATLSRAIAKGKMSALRSPETNSFKIDPAELHRFVEVLKVVRSATETKGEKHGSTRQSGKETPETPVETAFETRIAIIEERKARELAEARLADLKELIEDLKADRDNARSERDKWQQQAERLLLTHQPEPRRFFGWFGRR